MRIEHTLSQQLLKRRAVQVLVVGAGGTGSAILMGLPYLHQATLVWGHPCGLVVTVMDLDTVSPTNCVRQPFATSDIGRNKATVLVNRVNLFWGLSWSAAASAFTERSVMGSDNSPDLVIGCVDTRAARKTIHEALTSFGND
jgi:PRTRC genetic system ThiF family protein